MKEVRETGKEQLWQSLPLTPNDAKCTPSQQTKLSSFCDTSSIFLSLGEGASMAGEEMSTVSKSSLPILPVEPEGELCHNLTVPKEVT